jgi:hypothetical protein
MATFSTAVASFRATSVRARTIFKRVSLLGRRNLAAYRRFSLRGLVLMDPLEITASDDVHERAS